MKIKDWHNCETYQDFKARKEYEEKQDRRFIAGLIFVAFLLALGWASANFG